MEKFIEKNVNIRKIKKRTNEIIPGIIYGKNCNTNIEIEFDKKTAESFIFKGVMNTLFIINVDGKKYYTIIKEIQRNPINSLVTHIDFLSVDLQDDVEIKVGVVAKNIDQCEAIKAGAIIHIPQKQVIVECRADSLLHEIAIDVSLLKGGYNVSSDELKIKGAKFKKNIILLSIINEKEEVEKTATSAAL